MAPTSPRQTAPWPSWPQTHHRMGPSRARSTVSGAPDEEIGRPTWSSRRSHCLLMGLPRKRHGQVGCLQLVSGRDNCPAPALAWLPRERGRQGRVLSRRWVCLTGQVPGQPGHGSRGWGGQGGTRGAGREGLCTSFCSSENSAIGESCVESSVSGRSSCKSAGKAPEMNTPGPSGRERRSGLEAS